jgi:hypothetical protein
MVYLSELSIRMRISLSVVFSQDSSQFLNLLKHCLMKSRMMLVSPGVSVRGISALTQFTHTSLNWIKAGIKDGEIVVSSTF